MTNDDKPLDLDDEPFASGLDEPQGPGDATEVPSGSAPIDEGTDGRVPTAEVTSSGSQHREDPEPDPWGPGLGANDINAQGRPVADEWVRPAGQSSSLLLLMGVVILVMVGVVVFLAIKPDDKGDTADPPAAGAPLPAEGQPAAPDPNAPPPDTTPDPGNDPDLENTATITDDFERPGPELGALPGDGGTWNDQVGTVEIEKGTARVATVDDGSPLQLTTVDAGSADVTTEVRLPSPVDRSGLAIRVASPDRFIGLFATSEYGTYTLARFENGAYTEDDVIGNTDLTGVSVGDVIGIRASGSKVEVLTNGTVRNSFDDPKLDIDGTGVGLFAFLDDNGPDPIDAREFANWDDFKVLTAK